MTSYRLDETTVLRRACDVLSYDFNNASVVNHVQSTFSSMYGMTVEQFIILWSIIYQQMNIDPYFDIHHLLWTLYFIKQYSSRDVMSILFRVSNNTLTKWIWYTLQIIADLEIVSFIYIYIH